MHFPPTFVFKRKLRRRWSVKWVITPVTTVGLRATTGTHSLSPPLSFLNSPCPQLSLQQVLVLNWWWDANIHSWVVWDPLCLGLQYFSIHSYDGERKYQEVPMRVTWDPHIIPPCCRFVKATLPPPEYQDPLPLPWWWLLLSLSGKESKVLWNQLWLVSDSSLGLLLCSLQSMCPLWGNRPSSFAGPGDKSPSDSLGVKVFGATPASTPWFLDSCILNIRVQHHKQVCDLTNTLYLQGLLFIFRVFLPMCPLHAVVCDMTSGPHCHWPTPAPLLLQGDSVIRCCAMSAVRTMDLEFHKTTDSGAG